MRKNYIVPQMETEQVNHLAALCAGSGSADTIGIGGPTSESSITDGDYPHNPNINNLTTKHYEKDFSCSALRSAGNEC